MMLCFECKQNNNTIQKTNEVIEMNRIDANEYLKLVVNDYIEEKVRGSIEIETKYFSLAPFKMFYRSFFSSREEREENWINTFNRNGLSKVDLENYINQQITIYNKQNSQFAPLPQIKLGEINTHEIIDEKAFEALERMEFELWSQNIWFDTFLAICFFLIVSILLSLFTTLDVKNILLTFGVRCLIGILLFLLFFTFNDIKIDASSIIKSNNIEYLT